MNDLYIPDPGDWIAFNRDGYIKYAKVEYILPNDTDPEHPDYDVYTTEGKTRASKILDARQSHEIDIVDGSPLIPDTPNLDLLKS